MRLRECNYGKLNGAPKKEVESQKAERIEKPFPGGESYQNTSRRMKEFLTDLLKEYNNKTVLIIGHRATQYGLEHWIQGVPLQAAVLTPWQWQPGWIYTYSSLKTF